jgi:SAM-dependent methyltransferase
MRPPDDVFADPRQAALYDFFDGDRSDLDAYVAIAEEVGARRVLDVGCGTGCLASRLAGDGYDVVAVDPAAASLSIAMGKPRGSEITWVHGDATALRELPELNADLAVMTGNVAQVFVGDDDWSATLRSIHDSLRPNGWLAFETRRPGERDWERWSVEPTHVALPDGRAAIVSRTITDVALPFVTFESVTEVEGVPLRSTSLLRFRAQDEIERDLAEHGFVVHDVRQAQDRPGKEYVFLAQREQVTPQAASAR